jgi:hypothetical protein
VDGSRPATDIRAFLMQEILRIWSDRVKDGPGTLAEKMAWMAAVVGAWYFTPPPE